MKTAFSHNKTSFPVWSISQACSMPGVLMRCQYEKCNSICLANDGRKLTSLPNHNWNICPITQTHVNGTFYSHQDLANILDCNMKTFSNADALSWRLHKKLHQSHAKKGGTYLSQNVIQDFNTEEQHIHKLVKQNPQSVHSVGGCHLDLSSDFKPQLTCCEMHV